MPKVSSTPIPSDEHPQPVRRQLRGNRNTCPTCSQPFNSISAFDLHRVGEFGVDRRCLSTDAMLSIGMVLNDDGFWITRKRIAGLPVSPEGDDEGSDESTYVEDDKAAGTPDFQDGDAEVAA